MYFLWIFIYLETVYESIVKELYIPRGFSSGSVVKNPSANVGDEGLQVWSLGWEDPPEEGMATHSSILAWEIHGQMSLLGYSPWGHKELDTTWWLNNNNNPWAALW